MMSFTAKTFCEKSWGKNTKLHSHSNEQIIRQGYFLSFLTLFFNANLLFYQISFI